MKVRIPSHGKSCRKDSELNDHDRTLNKRAQYAMHEGASKQKSSPRCYGQLNRHRASPHFHSQIFWVTFPPESISASLHSNNRNANLPVDVVKMKCAPRHFTFPELLSLPNPLAVDVAISDSSVIITLFPSP